MSFILDALKKAESERNRSSGPVLMDVRLASPRRRLPAWAWVLGGVLLANLAVLAWLLLREPTAPVAPAAVAAAPTAQTLPPAPQPAAPAAAPALAPPPAAQPAPSLAPLGGAPAPIQAAPTAPPPAAAPAPFSEAGLPTAQDLIAAGVSLPPLQLNLHAYDQQPANRYVLLNGVRLREGEFTPDGIRVERITPRGVVLEASNRRFLLVAVD